MKEALLDGSLVNKRLNLRACIVGKSLETAVVKTYPPSPIWISSPAFRDHAAVAQCCRLEHPAERFVVKTFWSKLLIHRERRTTNGPNRRRRSSIFAIVTLSYFASEACRKELFAFE
jgi:hypothetical protein